MPVGYVAIDSVELDAVKDVRLTRGPANPGERMWVTLMVRGRCSEAERRRAVAKLARQWPSERRYSDGKYLRRFGCSSADVRKIATFARKNGIRVVAADPAANCVRLAGTVRDFSRAFAVKLMTYTCPTHGSYRAHEGPIRVPRELAPLIDGVFGFDTCPLGATPFLRPQPVKRPIHFTPPADVARAYRFPGDARGEGQCIGIIELGGGFHRSDLKHFFSKLGLKTPRISVVELQGQKNLPASKAEILRSWKKSRIVKVRKEAKAKVRNDPANTSTNFLWTVETTTDVELAGALANAAHIVVYFAPNTVHGKFDAYTSAIFDAKNRPSVISCSWGTREDEVPKKYTRMVDRLFQCAALRGVSICHSSGDEGAGSTSGHERVHFPASSPYALAVGGTELLISRSGVVEAYWDELERKFHFAGGHGVSHDFKTPPWQPARTIRKQTRRRGRAVPDVSGKADLLTAYWCNSAGIAFPGFGTSSAAPMWAALIARLNEKLGYRVGFLTPALYSRRCAGGTTPVARTSRRKNSYRWDKLTGLGSPNGEALVEALRAR